MPMFSLNRGSTLSTPLFDNRKCSADVAASAIGAGASLLGGLFGGMSQSQMYRNNQAFQQQQAVQSHDWSVQDATTAFDRQKQLMDLQDSYNTPLSQRQRLEQAGYNPFLADGSASGNLTSVPSVQESNEQSQAPVFQQGSPMSGLASGLQAASGSFASMYSALANSKAQVANANYIDSQNQRYQRQSNLKVFDTPDGVQSYAVDQQFYASVAQIRAYNASANRDAAIKAFQDMMNTMYSSNAVDESGNVIYNADGSTMTNLQYDKSLEQQATYSKVQSLTQEAIELASESKNIVLDSLLKKYELTNLMPQQLTLLKATINNVKSSTALNDADAHKAYADAFDSSAGAYLKQAMTQTENQMRPSKVAEQSGNAYNTWSNASRNKIDSQWYGSKFGRITRAAGNGLKDINPFGNLFK